VETYFALSTLGKLLEAVVAERISFAVETYGLLPANQSGARKQRSAEQALLLLQERIYTVWRGRKMVSLVSFDVKGAYNGVYKDRLLQRLTARGISPDLVNWINGFCSGPIPQLRDEKPSASRSAVPSPAGFQRRARCRTLSRIRSKC
jgi:hypothetical protein